MIFANGTKKCNLSNLFFSLPQDLMKYIIEIYLKDKDFSKYIFLFSTSTLQEAGFSNDEILNLINDCILKITKNNSLPLFNEIYKLNISDDSFIIRNTILLKIQSYVECGEFKNVKLFDSYTHCLACTSNNFELLKFIYDNTLKPNNVFEWSIDCCDLIIKNKNLEMLKWSVDRGCILNSDCYNQAIVNQDSEIINFLFLKSVKLDYCITIAIISNNLEILKLIVGLKNKKKENINWTNYHLFIAIRNCDLEIVKFLWNEKCPWNKDTTWCAVDANKLQTLKWLLFKKCPIDKEYCVKYCNNNEMKEWVIKNV